jgi:hypothetical protein
MHSRRVVSTLANSLRGMLVLAFMGVGAAPALAGDGSHDRHQSNALIKIVRESTERFRDVAVAENEDYHEAFGCVTGDVSGAMGIHYVNMGLVMDGQVDATRPEIVIYEAQPGGRLKLIGADYLVLAKAWDDAHPGAGAPQLNGQIFHLFEAPNRFGLPAFYTLHVWAWKENPTGAFTNWHANVSCSNFNK